MRLSAFLALASVMFALGAGSARSHGGEDHAEAPAPPVAVGGVGLATAEARGTYELFLRWGPVVAGQPFTLEAFVADATTNAPIEHGPGGLELALSGPVDLRLEAVALSPGQYRLTGAAATPGRYAATATVRGPAGVDLLTAEVTLATAEPAGSNVAPPPSSLPSRPGGADDVPLLWVVLALVLAAILAALGYVAGRRAGRGGDPGAASLERHAKLGAGLVAACVLVSLAVDRRAGAHGGEDHGDGPAAPVAAVGNGVRLPKDIQFLLGVRTVAVSRRDLTERRRVAGVVTLPPGARTSMMAPFTGRLEAAPDGNFPRLGEPVRRGQVLAVLVELPIAADRAGLAAERARAAAQRDGAAASLKALRVELQRKRSLVGIVATQELTDLEAAVRRAEAELTGARAAIEALTLGRGVTAFELVAPIDGVIGGVGARSDGAAASGVTLGGMVEGGAALFEIVDLTEPWVAAKVFEGDLRRVDRAMDAIVMGDDLPAAGVRATLVAVSPVVDPSTRTVDVIYALPRAAAPGLLPIPGAPAPANAPPVLRVNQFVRVDLPVGDAHDVLAVPVSAVVELDGVPSVWVKTRAEVFVARPVALGRREGGWIAVRGDLTPDARVVTEGAPFLRGAAPVVGAEGALRPTTGEAR